MKQNLYLTLRTNLLQLNQKKQTKKTPTRIHLPLARDNEHKKVFRTLIIRFPGDNSLKGILVRAKILQIKNEGWRGAC